MISNSTNTSSSAVCGCAAQAKSRFIALALSSALVALSSSGWAMYTPPTEGLVGWWSGDGNVTDSARGHTGILQKDVGYSTGKFGQAFDMPSGTQNRIYVPDSPDFALTESLTIGAWVYARQNCWDILMRGDNRTGYDPYTLGLDNAGNAVLSISSGSASKTISAPITIGAWHQVTGTLDGSAGNIRLYIDGSLVANDYTTVRPLGALIAGREDGLGIGNTSGTWDFPFIGLLDEVVLYNRAISPTEVSWLVPEPSSFALMVLAGAVFLARRGRQPNS